MTPIRKDEKEHLLNVCNKKFNLREQSISTEIQKDAQELADKKKASFLKLIKVDKKIETLIEAEKKYKKHVQNKDELEKKLLNDLVKKAKEVQEHLERVNKVRSWNKHFNDWRGHNIDEPPSEEFKAVLNTACYDESYKHIENNHKLKAQLDDMRDQVIMTINSGLALAQTQVEVKKIYNEAGIDYFLPKALLQLPSK
jgi:hypothetical protein|tara:strand:+ start:396 stop:989 length:594 start_codon:yes stop_codon:yes gene_type:complete